MREGLKPLVFVLQTTAGILLHAQRGGWNTIFGLGLPQPPSSICLIPLWLSPVNRPAMSHEKKKAGTRAPPPKKNRGVMRTRIAGIWNMPLSRSPWGRSRPHLSLREGSKQPPRSGADGRETDLCAIPFPLALHCVGSVLAVKGTLRRFAPWTACGPIRKTRCSRGKRGVVGSGRKGTFRSYQPP